MKIIWFVSKQEVLSLEDRMRFDSQVLNDPHIRLLDRSDKRNVPLLIGLNTVHVKSSS